MLEIWELKKQNNPKDLTKIDKLNKQLIDTRQILTHWIKSNQKKKK
jgi:urocanate hydratase